MNDHELKSFDLERDIFNQVKNVEHFDPKICELQSCIDKVNDRITAVESDQQNQDQTLS